MNDYELKWWLREWRSKSPLERAWIYIELAFWNPVYGLEAMFRSWRISWRIRRSLRESSTTRL